MPVNRPLRIPGRRLVLTKNMMIRAQENTNSASEASRWLDISYNTYKKPDVMVAEAKKLLSICTQEGIEQKKWGGRMHCLRWEHPATLYGWKNAGMTYDSTLGYADHVGFRCGTCFEYPAFDPVADSQLNLRIRPLIAMEVTVIAKRYMGLGLGQDAYDKFTKIKNACRAVNGSFTLLWHNDSLITKQARELYSSLLE